MKIRSKLENVTSTLTYSMGSGIKALVTPLVYWVSNEDIFDGLSNKLFSL